LRKYRHLLLCCLQQQETCTPCLTWNILTFWVYDTFQCLCPYTEMKLRARSDVCRKISRRTEARVLVMKQSKHATNKQKVNLSFTSQTICIALAFRAPWVYPKGHLLLTWRFRELGTLQHFLKNSLPIILFLQ
jgi:hypothetical protein